MLSSKQLLFICHTPNHHTFKKRHHGNIIDIFLSKSGFMDSRDLVRLTVQCPELDHPISLPFMWVAQLSSDRLLSEIERVLQSYEEFVVDQSLEIEVIHVKLPSGKGNKKKCYVDLEKSLKE